MSCDISWLRFHLQKQTCQTSGVRTSCLLLCMSYFIHIYLNKSIFKKEREIFPSWCAKFFIIPRFLRHSGQTVTETKTETETRKDAQDPLEFRKAALQNHPWVRIRWTNHPVITCYIIDHDIFNSWQITLMQTLFTNLKPHLASIYIMSHLFHHCIFPELLKPRHQYMSLLILLFVIWI